MSDTGQGPRGHSERAPDGAAHPGDGNPDDPEGAIPTVGPLARAVDPPLYPETPLETAWGSLKRTGALLLPVMGAEGDYRGVIRLSDLVHVAETPRPARSPAPKVPAARAPSASASAESGTPPSLCGRHVGELMVRFPYVDARASIWDAKQMMDDSGIGCLPVLQGRRLVGFVQSLDLFRAMLGEDAPPG